MIGLSNKGGNIMVNKDEIEGKVKEGLGKVTDNETKEAEGKLQAGFGKLKDKASELVDDAIEKSSELGEDIKEKASDLKEDIEKKFKK